MVNLGQLQAFVDAELDAKSDVTEDALVAAGVIRHQTGRRPRAGQRVN